jgi:hypothetical protein
MGGAPFRQIRLLAIARSRLHVHVIPLHRPTTRSGLLIAVRAKVGTRHACITDAQALENQAVQPPGT